MATYIGRNAALKLGEITISEMTDWSIDVSADIIREDTFGTDWAKKHGISATDWSAEANGLVDLTDTDGQEELWNAVVSGTKLTDVKFYVDDAQYYTPALSADSAAGCYVTSFTPNTAQGDIARFSVTFEGTGPIEKTEDI